MGRAAACVRRRRRLPPAGDSANGRQLVPGDLPRWWFNQTIDYFNALADAQRVQAFGGTWGGKRRMQAGQSLSSRVPRAATSP